MTKEHHIIYVPGLRDTAVLSKRFHALAEFFWRKQGFYTHLYLPNWEQGNSFAPKLKGITELVDELVEQGYITSLIGQSAGGSAVLNAFCERRNKVNGVVNITGRLKQGINVKPTLEQAARISSAFRESVLLFETKNEQTLTNDERKKVMTVRPLLDEKVPGSTVFVTGATNLVAPIVEHSLGGVFISTLYSKSFLRFLKKLER